MVKTSTTGSCLSVVDFVSFLSSTSKLFVYLQLSLEERRKRRRQERLALIGRLNEIRCRALPVYGVDLVSSLTIEHAPVNTNWGCSGYGHCKEAVINDPRKYWSQTGALREAIHSTEDRVAQLSEIFSRYIYLFFSWIIMYFPFF